MAKSRVESFTQRGGEVMDGRIQIGRYADKKKFRAIHNVRGVDIEGGSMSRKKDLISDTVKGSYARRELAKQLRSMKNSVRAGRELGSDTRRYAPGHYKVVTGHAATMQRRWPAGSSNGGQFKGKG